MDLIERTKDYFSYFSNKDIQNLIKIYANNISLKDWEIEVNGKDKVLEANKETFQKVDSLIINPIKIVCETNYTFSQIEISIDNDIKLDVIDVIRFNTNHQINFIRAYKG